MGVLGQVYGVLIPGIALVAGPHRPENSAEKFFYMDFDGQKCDFFCFLENMVKLCRMFNIGFLGAFRGRKDPFSAKYHISGHFITKYGFLKNRIFGDFLMIFLILQI